MSRRNLVWIAVVAGITVLFYQLTPMSAVPETGSREYAPLVEVDALIRRHYAAPVEGEQLVEGAIRGMLRKLDPYSGYIGPAEIESFRRRASGEFIGIGTEIGMHRGQITVIAPIEDSPAVSAGIRAGDVLLAVDGVSTEDLTVFEVSERLRGPARSEVQLLVRHPGREEAETVTVARGPVNVQSVKGVRLLAPGRWDYILDPAEGVAYVRVSSFQHDTTERFNGALEALMEQGAKALVLDLRFNPGGMMPSAIDMVDRFVAEGVLLATVSRMPTGDSAIEEFRAHPEDDFAEVPVVALVNGATASAAEIVAGSLQALGRATVVGSRSFGKGCVQHVIELKGHPAAIRLTVAYYRLPNGRVIHRTPSNAGTDEWGVIPDVEITLTETETQAVQEARRTVDGFASIAERDLARRERSTTGPESSLAPAIWIDPQLEAAIRVASQAVVSSATATARVPHPSGVGD